MGCFVDSKYLVGPHGILDISKIIFGFIAWVSIVSIDFWDPLGFSFPLAAILISWLSTILILILVAFLIQFIHNNCGHNCTEKILPISILVWNGIMTLFILIGLIVSAVKTADYLQGRGKLMPNYGAMITQMIMFVFLFLVYGLDTFLYWRERKTGNSVSWPCYS